jgi:hypothetical protein
VRSKVAMSVLLLTRTWSMRILDCFFEEGRQYSTMLNAVLHPTELWAMAKWKLTKVAVVFAACPAGGAHRWHHQDPDAIPDSAQGKCACMWGALVAHRRRRKESALVLLHAQQDEPFLRVRDSGAW